MLLSHHNSVGAGFSYLAKGFGEILKPGTKRYVLVPLLANLAIFVVLTAFLIQQYSFITGWVSGLLPSWAWLAYIAAFFSGLIIFFLLLLYGISFTVITNLIAAPFYGALAEKIESRYIGEPVSKESLGAMIIRTLLRELTKLWYFVTRGLLVGIGLFLLSFIPIVQLIVPFLAIWWGCWVMALQYSDYPADNHQLTFRELKTRLGQTRFSYGGFGGTILLLTMVPIVNIFIMPISVAGGTVFWMEELKD